MKNSKRKKNYKYTLFNHLNKFKNNFDVFITNDQKINKVNLNFERNISLRSISHLKSKEVILLFENNFNLAKWIYFLDGYVSRMVILSKNISSDEIKELSIKSGGKHIISDYEIELKNFNKIDINSLEKVSIKNIRLENECNENTEWIISTSGTTGKSKLVTHNLESLTRSTKINRKNDTWGLIYNLEKFAGIQVYLQALLSESTLVIPNNNKNLNDISILFSQNKVNCLSATPSLWKKLLMVKNLKIESLKNITLGGETSKNNILKALSKKFPNAKIRHIYASTEAGTGFVVSDGLEGFPLNFLDNNNSQVKIKISKEGTLMIKSNSCAKNYIGKDKLLKYNGYIDTGDIIKIENSRCFFVGRKNSVINIGGIKVYPERIEDMLEKMPGIVFAKVNAKKSSILGNLLEATIIVKNYKEDITKFKAKVKNYCNKHLEREMTPSFINIEKDIKLSNSGKIKRNEK